MAVTTSLIVKYIHKGNVYYLVKTMVQKKILNKETRCCRGPYFYIFILNPSLRRLYFLISFGKDFLSYSSINLNIIVHNSLLITELYISRFEKYFKGYTNIFLRMLNFVSILRPTISVFIGPLPPWGPLAPAIRGVSVLIFS